MRLTLLAAVAAAVPFAHSVAQPAAQPSIDPRYAPVITRLEKLIAHEMEDKGLPAVSVALVDDQQVVWAKGFGFADPARKHPATADTVYRVGSVSKLFTDIAVMQLVERGDLDLDASVTRYLPDFAPANPFTTPITLRHLMSHRAGLVREPPVGHYFDATSPTLTQTVASLNRTTLVYEPGTRTKYSNAGIAVVGRVLEVMAKQPFAEVLQQRVIAPLGLRQSTFAAPAVAPDLAKAFMWTYHGTQFAAPTFPLGMAPAGSMYASVTDLARFMSALFRRGDPAGSRVLKPETIEAMWVPQNGTPAGAAATSPLAPAGYGLGFNVNRYDGQRRIGHSGAIYGFATELQAFPDRKLGIAIATTLDGANPVMAHIAQEALSALLRAQGNLPPLPDLVLPTDVPVEQAKKLDGLYASDTRQIELRARGRRLIASLANTRADVKAINEGNQLLIDGRTAYGAVLIPRADGTISMDGQVYKRLRTNADEPKPADVSAAWSGLIGEYGWDHDVLYVLEREGKLYALIEWFFEYPLEEIARDRFAFPKLGLYDGEELRIVRARANGPVIGVDVGGVRFPRRAIGATPGQGSHGTFRITPLKPIAELRRIAASSQPPAESGKRAPDLVELSSLDATIKYEIRYATTNNFMGAAFYRQPRALLQRPAAEAVARANRALKALGYGLLIHDAYRPWAVTTMFWEATPEAQRVFVADPSQGSRHNRGCAVDLTLYDLATGRPVPMVGGYDEFSDRSYPEYPGGTSRQRWHRELLRRVMEAEGFAVFDAEWWHFDFGEWRAYPILNIPFERLGAKGWTEPAVRE